jgi:hypothetical protein
LAIIHAIKFLCEKDEYETSNNIFDCPDIVECCRSGSIQQAAEACISKDYAWQIPYGNNPKAVHFANAGDAKIYYEVYGKGEPFVLLHGGIFGATIEMAQWIDSLSKQGGEIPLAINIC